jgi:hypothetical protein
MTGEYQFLAVGRGVFLFAMHLDSLLDEVKRVDMYSRGIALMQ